ncbi:MAG: universal stress protein [Pseudohongiellaceae bacterium]
MNEQRSTVLACIDGSVFSRAVVDYAAWVSRKVSGPLKLLHNIEHRAAPVPDLSGNLGLGAREDLLQELTELESRRNRLLLQQGQEMLEAARQRAVDAGVAEPEMMKRHGSLAESLIDLEGEIRVLVLGIRGEDHEDQERSIGSQLETAIRAMHRPVLVVNGEFTAEPQRIMLAWDGSVAARKALEMVSTSPLYRGMECHLVHVSADADSASELLEEAASVLSRTPELTLVTAALEGDVEQALLRYQQENDIQMTVMGAFGHGRLRELLFGSRTANMLLQSVVPLLLLR